MPLCRVPPPPPLPTRWVTAEISAPCLEALQRGLPPLLLWGFEDLLDARLVGVQQRTCLHVLGDQLAACPWDVLPVAQHGQGQVFVCLLLLTCVDKGRAEPGELGRETPGTANNPIPLSLLQGSRTDY